MILLEVTELFLAPNLFACRRLYKIGVHIAGIEHRKKGVNRWSSAEKTPVTENTYSTWLAAETVGVYTYDGDQTYMWVWNSMYV